MNFIKEVLSTDFTHTLGWTLIHSLWQSLAIMILLWLLLSLTSNYSSQTRYLISCSGMLLMLASGIITFSILYFPGGNLPYPDNYTSKTPGFISSFMRFENNNLIQHLSESIQTNMHMVLSVWFLGIVVLSFRLLGGWWYITQLTKHAASIDSGWEKRLSELSNLLQIKKIISLEESNEITIPMVIGYMKPVILLPVGMLSGLNTAQIETIFIHELAHIKRHDYVVNIIQSWIEVIFFFNPFVWIISNMVRNQREFCCDDTVVSNHANTLAYAQALTRLEESRMNRITLGLSLAGNKNELLNRIKRIMKKSFNTSTGFDKIVPVTLMIAGLLCASWLTIQPDQKISDGDKLKLSSADTTIKKKNKKERYAPKNSAKANEKETINDDLYDDDEIDRFDAPVIPAMPSVPNHFPVPAIPPMEAIPHIEMDGFDIIQGNAFLNDDEWGKFTSEFEEKFSERFKDFYKVHGEDLAKMMEELQTQFSGEFRQERMSNMQAAIAELDFANSGGNYDLRIDLQETPNEMSRESQRAMEEKFRMMEDEMKGFHENHAEKEKDLQALSAEMAKLESENHKHFDQLEKEMKGLEKNMKLFEESLKEQLITDGYISKTEKIENMHWKANGDIEINGKKIKEGDKKKYEALHGKYFGEKSGNFRYVE